MLGVLESLRVYAVHHLVMGGAEQDEIGEGRSVRVRHVIAIAFPFPMRARDVRDLDADHGFVTDHLDDGFSAAGVVAGALCQRKQGGSSAL
jgi:hypothetical protein